MHEASDLARLLARNAEHVCRAYLPRGRRHGRYWLVGDVLGAPGRSLYVRLTGPETGAGAAGKWTDAATLEHGDLLDLIAQNRRFATLADTLEEARRFLALPRPEPVSKRTSLPAPPGSSEAARRLFAISRPIQATLAQAYLRARGLTSVGCCPALRFHPRCYYRGGDGDPQAPDAWPAMIAAVTDLSGTLTGVHRTWLDLSGRTKAPVSAPRKALGHLLGSGVRFGTPNDILAAGEGIETMLSLRQVLPALPAVAALSAGHLAALELAPTLRRLYLARDEDPAGHSAVERLSLWAAEAGIEAVTLQPVLGDFNEDLTELGAPSLRATLEAQLRPEDVARFRR